MDPLELTSITSVQRLGLDHVPVATRVLCKAFRDYPVMRYVLGAASRDYELRLATLIRFFVMARLLRGEPVLGAVSESEIGAVALVSHPDGPPGPAELDVLREETWAELRADARDRYERFGQACRPFFGDLPRIHLNMVGVRPALRARGLSRRLLDEVHQLAHGPSGAIGVSLTTEDAGNLSLYAHLGYRVVGHARVDADLESWGLFRSKETGG